MSCIESYIPVKEIILHNKGFVLNDSNNMWEHSTIPNCKFHAGFIECLDPEYFEKSINNLMAYSKKVNRKQKKNTNNLFAIKTEVQDDCNILCDGTFSV